MRVRHSRLPSHDGSSDAQARVSQLAQELHDEAARKRTELPTLPSIGLRTKRPGREERVVLGAFDELGRLALQDTPRVTLGQFGQADTVLPNQPRPERQDAGRALYERSGAGSTPRSP